MFPGTTLLSRSTHSLKSSPSSPVPIVFHLQPHYFTPMVPFLLKPRSPWWLPQLPIWCSCCSSLLLKQFSSPRSDHHPPANKKNQPTLSDFLPLQESVQFNSTFLNTSQIPGNPQQQHERPSKPICWTKDENQIHRHKADTQESIFINLYAFRDCFLIDKKFIIFCFWSLFRFCYYHDKNITNTHLPVTYLSY